jgi:sugar lactone lactonase YvrE
MLPRVRELEQRFGEVLVAIGVHAGKYVEERRTRSIGEACLRLGVHHPVLNDRQFRTWRVYGVQAWPTLAFVDPDGYLVAREAGELPFEALEAFVQSVLSSPAGSHVSREAFELPAPPDDPPTTPLLFPGKLLATGRRLFVSDTGHHSILELSLEEGATARVIRRLGSGRSGLADGPAERAAFLEPQGLSLHEGALVVADRGNHAVRRVDLASGQVTTLAGTGELGRRLHQGTARKTALRSPWDLCAADGTVFIAMAGAHQIWRLDPASGDLRPHAGSGAEAIDDGPLTHATLAQPSGLTLGGDRLYFADAESSAIRRADLTEDGRVETLVGTGLFDFGDRDGIGDGVRLQHPLAVAWHAGRVLVADSYNGKLKTLDPASRACTTLEVRVAGSESGESPFSEPGGLTLNGDLLYVADTGNHRVVRVPLAGGGAEVLEIEDR